MSGTAKAALPALKQDNTKVVNHAQITAAYKTNRPAVKNRLYTSQAVEAEILRVKKLLTNAKLAWMFENCFPNTLDTTVHYRLLNGKPDTFVYTGDIHAMWLRDSGAQVWPYVQLANQDPELKKMLEGVIRRQFKMCIRDRFIPTSTCTVFEDTGHHCFLEVGIIYQKQGGGRISQIDCIDTSITCLLYTS